MRVRMLISHLIQNDTHRSARPKSLASSTRRLDRSFQEILTNPFTPLPIGLLVHYTSTRILFQAHHLLYAVTPGPLSASLPPLIDLPSQRLHILHCTGLGRLNTICLVCYRHTQASLATTNARGTVSIPITRYFSTQHRKDLCSL